MPVRKKLKSLEELSLQTVPRTLRKLVSLITVTVVEYEENKRKMMNSDSVKQKVQDIFKTAQSFLFESVAHYFHKELSQNLLHIISLHLQNKDEAIKEGRYLTLSEKQMTKLRREINSLINCTSILCHPSLDELTLSASLNASIVPRMLSLLPLMPWLTLLDVRDWPWRFSVIDQYECFTYLPNLVKIAVNDVSLEFFINIASFCTNLQSLILVNTEVFS